MDTERIVMELIMKSGNARGKAFEAISYAEQRNFEEAERLMKECAKELNLAHITQTDLIQGEINGEGISVDLLLVHAQDHLMTAITVKELAEKIIRVYKEIK